MTDSHDSDQSPPKDDVATRKPIGRSVISAIVVCLFAGGIIYSLVSRSDREIGPPPAKEEIAEEVPTRQSPEARWHLNDYVGSEKCAECHAEIAETFAEHPMANTLATVAEASPIEVIKNDASEFEAFGRQYRVERDGDRMIHTEFMTDDDDQTIYEQSEEVHFAVGSGNERSHIHDQSRWSDV